MKVKGIYSVIVLLVLAIATLLYLQIKNSKKIGYVTTLKVFEEFTLKKELERDYKKVQMAKQSYLDSLKLGIQELSIAAKTNDNENKINTLKKIYLLKEDQFNRENETLFNGYTEQIWKQLNQYIEDYGKEKGYDYLLGASGQGNIMYASEKEDLTKDIINYVNSKYSGKK